MESEKERKGSQNYAIEFYRFLFTFVVFVLHFRGYGKFQGQNGQFNGGYLAVEFFFILCGFFLAQNFEKNKLAAQQNPEHSAIKYLLTRYLRILPQYLWALFSLIFFDVFFVQRLTVSDAVTTICNQLLKGFPDLLLIQAFWRPYAIDYFTWYISAMLWASVTVYYLLAKKYEIYLYIVAPLVLLGGLGYLFKTVGHIDVSTDFPSFLRAFIEIGLGVIVFYVLVKVKQIIYIYIYNSHKAKILVTITEALLLFVIVYIMYYTRRDYKDFVMVFLLGVMILLTFIDVGYVTKLLNRKIFAFFGNTSLAIYLNQRLFQRIAWKWFPNEPFWSTTLLLFFALTIYSYFLTSVGNRVMKAIGKKIIRK